jgi:glycosyltransferase involved in cell wall biosynthesis
MGFQEQPEEIYPIADVILSTSTFGEGFQNSIAEGMASELIPICTVSGDIKILVGNAGFIVEPATLAGLQVALQRVADMAVSARRESGAKARERIVANFRKRIFHDAFCATIDDGLN